MYRRLILLVVLLVLWAIPAAARQRVQGYCEDGGQQVTVSGLVSTTYVQKSYVSATQGCTVTVFLAGTITVATLYSDDSGTPLANPFTAAKSGQWFFYADTGRYDVRFSNGGITTPFTRGDWPTGGMLNVYPGNQVPIAGNAGALILQNTGARGLWFDTGLNWVSVSGQVTNIRTFDAHGNGFADDTTAIQNAINAACLVSPPSAVYIPSGTYQITSTLTLCTGLTVYGDGAGSILRMSGNNTGMTLLGSSGSVRSNVLLRDFVLEKIAGSLGSIAAIQLTWVNDTMIERVTAQNNGGVWGLFVGATDTNRVRVIDSKASGMASNVLVFNTACAIASTCTGASTQLSTTSGANNAVIRGTYTANAQGVDLYGQTDFLVDGGIFTGNLSTFAYGIVIEGGTRRGTITNVYSAGHNYGALDFEPGVSFYEVIVSNSTFATSPTCVNLQTGGGLFQNNIFDTCSIVGLVSTGGQGGMFVGNQFRANAIGLSWNNGFKNSAVGNYFVNNTSYGFQLAGTQSTQTLVANQFAGNGADYNGLAAGQGLSIVEGNPLNLRGTATIADGNTSVTINTLALPDANYRVVCTATSFTNAPAAGSSRCYITAKSTSGFILHSEVAPGAGSSEIFDWIVIR